MNPDRGSSVEPVRCARCKGELDHTKKPGCPACGWSIAVAPERDAIVYSWPEYQEELDFAGSVVFTILLLGVVTIPLALIFAAWQRARREKAAPLRVWRLVLGQDALEVWTHERCPRDRFLRGDIRAARVYETESERNHHRLVLSVGDEEKVLWLWGLDPVELDWLAREIQMWGGRADSG